MKKYKIENVDCASCAANIENNLRKLDFVKDVSINMASSHIYLDTGNLGEVKSIIKKIEPKVEIVDNEETSIARDVTTSSTSKRLIKICFVLTLLLAGSIFKDLLHQTPYAMAEYAVFLFAYLLSGWGVLKSAGRNIIRGKIFNEHFLMSIATIGAIAINEIPEAVAVMVFYNVGEFFQELAVNRSRRSIKSLLEIRPDRANLKVNGKLKQVSPEEVLPGQEIVVKPGEKIPLDGEVIDGHSFVDTSALTGESVPKQVKKKDAVLAGMINKSGVITIRVTRLFGESSISKILDLVEKAASKKAETEKFITTFSRYYTPVVVIAAILISILPPLLLQGQLFSDWIYRALVVLVVSCPCALVISIPLGYFGGIGGASRQGILVKGSNFLDALTKVKTVVFDKTGTLTKGEFKVSEIITQNGFRENELLEFAAFAESQSNHPIAQSVLEAFGKEINPSEVKEIQEISGYGIKAKVKNKIVIVGNDRLLHHENISHDSCHAAGTVVHIAVDQIYAGYIIISDGIKEDASSAVTRLKELGVKKIVMLTGDNRTSAGAIAEKLDIDSFHSELLPEDKVVHIEKLIAKSRKEEKVAFVGDGINDAPVLARADVGIAMGALGSDAAVETADIVLMTDMPSKVATAIAVARKTRKIVWQNIIFAMGVKLFFIVSGSMGLATMWEAVFGDMGVALIAILNAARVLRR
jgi:Cd2+/Zn2+-exporting ATPase